MAQAQPKNPTVQCELGQTLRQNGDLSASVAAFERALEIDPEMREAYYGLGFTLKQQAAAAHKGSAEPLATYQYHKEAQDALAKGDLNMAKEELLMALAADENDGTAHNLLGYILGQQGDPASALSQLERAIALRPDAADVHYNYGAALWYSGEKQKAVSELITSIRLDPSASSSYALLGMAQREEGDLAGSEVRSRNRRYRPVSNDRGYLHRPRDSFLRRKELHDALAQFDAGLNAISAAPAPDWDGAITALRETISKDPRSPEVHNMLGLLLGAQRRGQRRNPWRVPGKLCAGVRNILRLTTTWALCWRKTVRTRKPSTNFVLRTTSFEFRRRSCQSWRRPPAIGRGQAIAELEKAVSSDPASVNAQFNLAEAYGNSPKYGTARQVEQLRKSSRLHPTLPEHILHWARPCSTTPGSVMRSLSSATRRAWSRQAGKRTTN